jgi:hypothetical protein
MKGSTNLVDYFNLLEDKHMHKQRTQKRSTNVSGKPESCRENLMETTVAGTDLLYLRAGQ